MIYHSFSNSLSVLKQSNSTSEGGANLLFKVMPIYIYKNNQQTGPFEESQILEMLKRGELSTNDMAIRRGEKEWQKLGVLFPSPVNRPMSAPVAPAAPVAPVAQAASPAKKSRKGLLLGCGGFLLLLLLVGGVLGFLAYRNMYPADSTENLPDKVKDMKLMNRYPPKGDIWGTKTDFVGLYESPSKSETVLYLMTVYKDESAAKDAMRSDLLRSCQTGETPMYFTFVDKNGKDVSQGATCAVPLYVQKDNKVAAIGGSGAGADTFIEFAENLPFNVGTTMKKKDK